MSGNLLMTALLPHPPIIIHEVGGSEILKVAKTVEALNKLSQRIVSLDPDLIVIITPHSVLDYDNFNIYSEIVLKGNFARFGAPQVNFSVNNDMEFLEELVKNLSLPVKKLSDNIQLDHGSMVPLYFLINSGYRGKISVINYSALSGKEHIEFGKIISRTISELERKTVFIASGDLSHRLTPQAPAGYEPQARYFDELVINSISNGNYNDIIKVDPNLRYVAGECAFNSLMVAMGVIDTKPVRNEVLSYEAPFGVGYAVATL